MKDQYLFYRVSCKNPSHWNNPDGLQFFTGFIKFELISEEDDFKTIYELICEKEGITNCDVVSLSKVQ